MASLRFRVWVGRELAAEDWVELAAGAAQQAAGLGSGHSALVEAAQENGRCVQDPGVRGGPVRAAGRAGCRGGRAARGSGGGRGIA
jgi:hypothetical protein